jgi:prepilin-type N-terminal cleavage/methylation domain-containing protein
MNTKYSRRAFTLIELLVVVAVIAVLAVIVVLILNPSVLFQQARDATRVSDMNTLTKSLNTYNAQLGGGVGYSLGTPGLVYLSLPDPAATTTAGSNCAGLGFPSTGYHCPASSTYRNTNGTGWIPVNFSSLSTGSPVSALPVDPVNTTSSGQYYEYSTDGSNYEIVAKPESQKYSSLSSNFVAGSMSGLISSYSTSTYTTGGFQGPYGIAFDSHTNTIWTGNSVSNVGVTEINDLTGATTTHGILAGIHPALAVFDPNTNTIWTANTGNNVSVFNDTTYATSTYAIGAATSHNGIVFDPHTNTIWVGSNSTNTVTLINDATYATSSPLAILPSGNVPNFLAFDPHTNTIWAAVGNSLGTIVVIDDTTYTYTVKYNMTGTNTSGLVFDPHTNTIWAANNLDNSVTQINDTTYATSSYPIGAGPAGIAFNPKTNTLWVTNGTAPYGVTTINDTTYATSSYALGFYPQSITFDPHTNAMWVAHPSNQIVTEFSPNL